MFYSDPCQDAKPDDDRHGTLLNLSKAERECDLISSPVSGVLLNWSLHLHTKNALPVNDAHKKGVIAPTSIA